jgi:formiminotetrahydrofolate cyclodeaminase
MVAVMAAALVAMAARITAANPKYAEMREHAERISERADMLRAKLLEARHRDEAAFAAVMRTRGEERQRALHEAAQAPLAVMHDALDVERLALEATALQNPHLASDLGCAAEFAAAALKACAYNVRINHRSLKDAGTVTRQRSELERYERESAEVLDAIRKQV